MTLIIIRSFLIVMYIVTLSSCTNTSTIRHSEQATSNRAIYWPPAPQTPRIQYKGYISGPSHIGIKKTWLSKVIDRFFGRIETDVSLVRPYGIYSDQARVYVTDPGAFLIHVFDEKKREYFQIHEANDHNLISPIGISVDEDGNIFVSDSVLRRVFLYDRNAHYVDEFGSDNIFLRPTGIAVYKDRIYVVDTHGHCIYVLSKREGTVLFCFGKHGNGNGEFNFPTNIFIDETGLVYITDSMNFRIQIFNQDGIFLQTFGKLGDGSGDFSKPKGVAVAADGNIYVADAHFDNVQIFDRTGRLLLVFGNSGHREGEMLLPAGIFINKQNMIYVADSYNRRINIFQYLGDTKQIR